MADSSAQPWLANKRWRDGKVSESIGVEVVQPWVFALLFAGFSVPLILGVLHQPAMRHDFPVVFAFAFPLVALLLFVLALRRTARWFRFGTSVFEMATFPGVIGGQLVGVVYTKTKLVTQDGFYVALNCVHRVRSGHGNSESTHDVVIWHEEQHLVRGAMEQDMTRTAIPVGFRIPRDCRPSFRAAGYDEVFWKLRVRAKVQGVDYEANFDVPVYITPDSANSFADQVDPVAPYRAPEIVRTAPGQKGVKFWKDAAGAVHVRFRAARNFGATLGWCVITAIVMASTYFLWQQPRKDLFTRIVLGIMGDAFGFVSLLLFLVCFVLLFQHKEVAADAREVVVKTRYFFFQFTRRVEAKDVLDVRMTQNQTSGEKAWFEIDLVVPWKKADGSVSERNVCVGSGIEKADADWLVGQLKEAVHGKVR